MVDLETIEARVKHILEYYPETRGSDPLLIMTYKVLHNHDASIRRARRKVQEWARELILGGNAELGSKYLPSEKIQEMRDKRAELHREYYKPKGAA